MNKISVFLKLIVCLCFFTLEAKAKCPSNFNSKSNDTIIIRVSEPYCSLCLIQLNDVLKSRKFQKNPILVMYSTMNSERDIIFELKIKDYLSDLPFEIMFENADKKVETPYLEINKEEKVDIIEYSVLFENFNRKKAIRTVCKALK